MTKSLILISALLTACYSRTEIRAESKRISEAVEVYEDCSFFVGKVYISAERLVIKELECQTVHELWTCSYCRISQYSKTFDDCQWNYISKGLCK